MEENNYRDISLIAMLNGFYKKIIKIDENEEISCAVLAQEGSSSLVEQPFQPDNATVTVRATRFARFMHGPRQLNALQVKRMLERLY